MDKLLLALAVAICALAVATTSAAVGAPKSPGNTGDFLTAHNKARVAAKVHLFSWGPNLALEANQIVRDQSNLKICNFTRLPDRKYGINQWQSVGLIGCSPQTVVNQWLMEKVNYDEETKSCLANDECRSYLQVVAKNTLFLGCGQATCSGTNGGCLAMCLYDPPARGTA
ncbi:STS14 protein-like [Apium graveolens]|uniref:STS14 protein-like n=1 Tax=Apium graveolens TaxID=4045 RepID=UPI003D79F98E